ncbi:hypothetical protein TOPH_06244 [Tolypocladium ophioglossoides CBS 100239]|uniref:Uncharacterized protein n=1 Tax=Tolypocladium ophioglossoides (strain CBS 100239) TaxID=1163406 RepID=A0A0L0N4Y8_TOLOC|nr:hypothetical protein TOPH_06244 [Tolypocladium ophioglossoides CBS 100239]
MPPHDTPATAWENFKTRHNPDTDTRRQGQRTRWTLMAGSNTPTNPLAHPSEIDVRHSTTKAQDPKRAGGFPPAACESIPRRNSPSRRDRGTQLSIAFRTRLVSASGTLAHPDYPSVWRLHVHPSTIQRFIELLTDLLPAAVGSWIRHVFPEWFLPTDIILKSEKREQEEHFDAEVRVYKQLRPL